MFRHYSIIIVVLGVAAVPIGAAEPEVQVSPAAVSLNGNFARTQLLASLGTGDRAADLTHKAAYQSSNPAIVTVGPTGQLLAVADGSATVTVTVGNTARPVPVTVTGVSAAAKIGFMEHVMPVLSKAGCNAGACHASQHGKGGFKLSVFGFAPLEDYKAIVRDSFGRRSSTLTPSQSLFLQKATGNVPHQGGKRLDVGSIDYKVLENWLVGGAPGPGKTYAKISALEVQPAKRVGPPSLTQQIRVVATYSDGRNADVTHWAKFDSTDDGVLKVDARGLVQAVGKGQGAAMVRFEGQAAVVPFVVPYADKIDLTGWKDNNFIDRFAGAKFREIGIPPSPLCDDAVFLRRAFVDVVGTLPTVDQARAFLDSPDPDKRSKLIDRLLGLMGDPSDPSLHVHDNDYAAFWALKWSDLIRSNSAVLGEQGMWALHNWLKESFRQNKPFDRLVRELITAKGSTFSNGPANYFRVATNPENLTEATSQLFLGVRLQCARCHNHPFEPLSQADYYGFAAFFARVGIKGSHEFGLFGGEIVVINRAAGEVAIPRIGIAQPTPLRGKPVIDPPDRRLALADWLTSKENPYLARNLVNRYFAYLLGRGLVEPIDDVRATNVPSNPELLDALAQEFVKLGFDQKRMLRLIMNSRLYQLDSRPTPANALDSKFNSHYYVKRLAAEALLDAVDAAAGTATKFDKVPLGTRAIELPDAKYSNYFLSTFGKPRREAVCECERVSEPNLAQALHTLNGDLIEAKIADANGRIAALMAAKQTHDEIVENLYLATLSRRPSAAERDECKKLLAEATDAKAYYQDLLWTLFNTKQFQFAH